MLRLLGLLIGLVGLVDLSPVSAKTLRVGLSGSPPFVMAQSDDLSDLALKSLNSGDVSLSNRNVEGISIQIWEEVAERLDQTFQYVQLPNTDANVNAVADGAVDLAVGPISITPDRLANPKIDFTQPYFHGHQGVMLPMKAPGIWARLKPFFGWAALSSLGGLLVLLFLVGNLMWLAERRRNVEHFPRDYLHGVGNGMWFALVTLTTVGYGDRSPTTRTGRVIAGVWMVMSLLALSSITAGLASAFTVSLSNLEPSAIRDRADLRGKTVAVVSGTTSNTWAKLYGARAIDTTNLETSIELLGKNKVDAVLFDAAPLRYYLRQNPQAPFKMAPFTLASQTYGFVLPTNSDLRTPIDVVLLEMQRSGQVKRITDELLE